MTDPKQMTPVLVGYFPKRSTRGLDFANEKMPTPIEETCNVACAAPEPENWIDLWMHNEMWLYDSERRAWAVAIDDANLKHLRDQLSANWDGRPGSLELPTDQYILRHIPPPYAASMADDPSWQWDLYAYRVFPVSFSNGVEAPFPFPPLEVQPLPDDYDRLGFDPVSRMMGNMFEHSPLFCNGWRERVAVNRYCLLDDLGEALRLGREFSIGEFRPDGGYCGCAEPGPYLVAEVWRKRRPPGP